MRRTTVQHAGSSGEAFGVHQRPSTTRTLVNAARPSYRFGSAALLLWALLFLSGMECYGETVPQSDVLTQLADHLRQIQSISARYTCEYHTVLNPKAEWRKSECYWRWTADDKELLEVVESTARSPEAMRRVYAWDGTTQRMLWAPQQGQARGQGRVSALPAHMAAGVDDLRSLTVNPIATESGAATAERLRAAGQGSTEVVMVSGERCAVVEFPKGELRKRCWLNLQRGAMPQRVELWYGTDPEPSVSKEIQLVEVRPGLWLPRAATVRTGRILYGERRTGNYREGGVSTVAVDVSSYRINEELTEKDFGLEFPNGTSVYDEIAQITYVVGELEPDLLKETEGELDRLVAESAVALKGEPPTASPAQVSQSPSARRSGLLWFRYAWVIVAAAVAALAAVLGGYLLNRRRRRRCASSGLGNVR